MNKLRDSGIYEKLTRDSGSRPSLPDPVLIIRVSLTMEVGCLCYPEGSTFASQPFNTCRIMSPWLENLRHPARSPHAKRPEPGTHQSVEKVGEGGKEYKHAPRKMAGNPFYEDSVLCLHAQGQSTPAQTICLLTPQIKGTLLLTTFNVDYVRLHLTV